MALIDDLLQMFGQQGDEANQANEDRYGDIMRQLGRTQRQVGRQYGKASNLTRNLGRAGQRQINRQARDASAQALSSSVQRGLGSSTVVDALNRQIERDRSAAQADNREQVQAQRAGILMSRAGSTERLGGLIAQMMEARTDAGPDPRLLAQLAQQAGQGEGAGAGGGGGMMSGGMSSDAGALGRAWAQENIGGGSTQTQQAQAPAGGAAGAETVYGGFGGGMIPQGGMAANQGHTFMGGLDVGSMIPQSGYPGVQTQTAANNVPTGGDVDSGTNIFLQALTDPNLTAMDLSPGGYAYNNPEYQV